VVAVVAVVTVVFMGKISVLGSMFALLKRELLRQDFRPKRPKTS
jgi:hypothetical protein